MSAHQIWKTIKLGGIKDADGFREAIDTNGMRLGIWANDILGKSAFTVAAEKSEVNLVIATVGQLGFKGGVTLKDLYTAAQNGGLQLCPAEVGPQLCLQYKDQEMDDWIIIGMEPIATSDGYLRLFSVSRNDDGRWLGSYCGDHYHFLNRTVRFVFVLPSK